MMTIRVRDGSMKLAHIQHEVNTSYRRGHMRQRNGSASRDLALRTYVREYEYYTYVRTGVYGKSSTRDVENGVVYRKLKKDGA